MFCNNQSSNNDSLTFLEDDKTKLEIRDRTFKRQKHNTDIDDEYNHTKDHNFKKPKANISNNKQSVVKASTNVTDRTKIRMVQKLRKTKNENKSSYSSALPSKTNPAKNTNSRPAIRRFTTHDSRISLKNDTQTNSEKSKSELTYSDKQHDLIRRQPFQRISLFRAMAPNNNKLTKRPTFHNNEQMNTIISKVKLQRLHTEPFNVVDIDTDKEIKHANSRNRNGSQFFVEFSRSYKNIVKPCSLGRFSINNDTEVRSSYFGASSSGKETRKMFYPNKATNTYQKKI